MRKNDSIVKKKYSVSYCNNTHIHLERGAGSCIFLHNWSSSNETMAGCTGMAPEHMKDIVYWLSKKKDPILIQLTRNLYHTYQQEWELPTIDR